MESSRGLERKCRYLSVSIPQRTVCDTLTALQMEGKADDKTEILLNPARALVGAYGENKDMADAFAAWIAKSEGGQKVVGNFAVNGVVLYTRAP